MLLALGAQPVAARLSAEELGQPVSIEDPAGPVGLMTLPPAPAATGTMPAVLLVHDTLGPDQRSLPYVEQLAAAGLLVLEIAPEPDEPDAEVVRRGVAALRAHPGVDPARIGLLGFGGGARAAMLATVDQDAFAARALLYPGCAGLLRDLPAAPSRGGLLLLHGAEDPANAEADCVALAQRLAGGAPTRRVMFRGASYAWDFPSAEPLAPWLYPAPGDAGRVRIRPWPALTALSATEVASFFAFALSWGGL
ncbi:dienelactone hydrolase family protein [Roseomonas fluvialis]|uniref:dienelactone hydrolase family protein n=1 Tax=Roseomonas fluvialis TaxID=1750527 RepID=UPI001FCAC8A3|nr:hypothetical protein [Roseomonas fluvialis]